jgi:hypothetical protein
VGAGPSEMISVMQETLACDPLSVGAETPGEESPSQPQRKTARKASRVTDRITRTVGGKEEEGNGADRLRKDGGGLG